MECGGGTNTLSEEESGGGGGWGGRKQGEEMKWENTHTHVSQTEAAFRPAEHSRVQNLIWVNNYVKKNKTLLLTQQVCDPPARSPTSSLWDEHLHPGRRFKNTLSQGEFESAFEFVNDIIMTINTVMTAQRRQNELLQSRSSFSPTLLRPSCNWGITVWECVCVWTHAHAVVLVPRTHYIIHLAGRAEALIPSPPHTTTPSQATTAGGRFACQTWTPARIRCRVAA